MFNILTKLKVLFGKYCYFLYLPLGIGYGYIRIFTSNFTNKADWVEFDDIESQKKSDTIFILGSGSSISTYSDKQWQDIESGDSLGFNFWLLHDFTPTYYMFELPRDHGNLNDFIHNLDIISEKYDKTLMFLKQGTKGKKNYNLLPDKLKGRVKVLYNPTLPIPNRYQISSALTKMNKIIKHKKKKLVVFNKRASLFSAVVFAYVCGYKNIILCGIDLNTTDYFYEYNQKETISKGLKIPNSGQSGQVHKTNNQKFGQVTITELLKKLNTIVLKPSNVNLYTGSKQSALYEWLDSYWEV